jgi:hypothetical protein
MKRLMVSGVAMLLPLYAGVFDNGQKNVALTVGSGSGYNSSYTIVGLTANYFALNGLSVGLGYRGWFGGTPTINEVDLPVTYYVPLKKNIRPYAGGFYRHSFISDGFDDYDTYGARAGLSYVKGSGYVSIGWAQEWYSRDNGDKSSRGYPEISAGASF